MDKPVFDKGRVLPDKLICLSKTRVSNARGLPRGMLMPSPRGCDKLRMPHPRDWQREQMPRGCPGGDGHRWNWLMHYWELNHSSIPYATSSGARVAYFPYATFVSVISFNDIRFVSYIVLKFVGVSSKHLRVFLGSLRKSSEIFGKCSGTFVWYSEQFWKIFGNLRKVVGNLWKIIKNAVISMSI